MSVQAVLGLVICLCKQSSYVPEFSSVDAICVLMLTLLIQPTLLFRFLHENLTQSQLVSKIAVFMAA